MSNIIKDFCYGNIEPQKLRSELSVKLTKNKNNSNQKIKWSGCAVCRILRHGQKRFFSKKLFIFKSKTREFNISCHMFLCQNFAYHFLFNHC